MPILAPKQTKKGFIWTFRAENLVSLVFSPSRSGETARKVLGQSNGYLVVDGFTDYNSVTVPDRRLRVACWAHVRRRFFGAKKTTPEAREMLELILDLYRMEKQAAESSILGTSKHLELRHSASAAAVGASQIGSNNKSRDTHPSVRWARQSSTRLASGGRCRDSSRTCASRSTNNWSERALRVPALGRNYADLGIMRSSASLPSERRTQGPHNRKNYLFGGDKPGGNIGGLYFTGL